MKDYCISDEMFLAASQKGIEHPKHKKYFEQLINFNDYNYFKKMMCKRNYQILKQAELAMNSKEYKAMKSKNEGKFDQKDIEEAIKISMKEAEDKKKLEALEDEDLKVKIFLINKNFL